MFIRKGIIRLYPTHIARKVAHIQVREYVNALIIKLKPWGEKEEERVSKIPKISLRPYQKVILSFKFLSQFFISCFQLQFY